MILYFQAYFLIKKKVTVHFIHVHSFFQTIDPTRYRLSALQRFTTETGRLFFRTRSKQLPLARKENVLGHVEKRVWAHSFALCSSVFPSRFFSVVDLLLSLLVQHDKDKVYRLCFSHRAKTFHFHLQKNPPSPCDFWLASGTWRNVMTCASLGDVSYRPLEPNSNTCPDSSNCFPRLRKETVYLFR